jgi:hypothetical protein
MALHNNRAEVERQGLDINEHGEEGYIVSG